MNINKDCLFTIKVQTSEKLMENAEEDQTQHGDG